MRGVLLSTALLSVLSLAAAFCPAPPLRAAHRGRAGGCAVKMVWSSKSIKLMKDDPIQPRGKEEHLQARGDSAEPAAAQGEDATIASLLLNLKNDWQALEASVEGLEADLGVAKSTLSGIGAAQQKGMKHFGSVQTRVGKAESLLAWERKNVQKLKGLIKELPENIASMQAGGHKTHAENAWMRGRDGELKKAQEAYKDIAIEVEALCAWANFFRDGGREPAK